MDREKKASRDEASGQQGAEGARGVFARLVMVREGEWPAVLLAGGYFFCLLMSYYLVRPVREAMGIQRGYDDLPWLITGTLVAMAAINPVFAWVVSRTPRRVFVPWVYRFFAANLVLFFALFEWGGAGVWLGYAFYIWLSVFNLFVVSIYWGLLGDLFGPERARRLFGVAAVGGTLGAIAGAAATGALSGGFTVGGWSVKAGPGTLMLLSAGVLEAAVWCAWGLMRRFGVAGGADGVARLASAGRQEPGPGVLEGLKKVARSAYLQLIALYVFLYTTTSTFLYIEQGRIVGEVFLTQEARTAAFAWVDLCTNVLTLTVQLFLTGRVMMWIGLRGTLMVLPILTAVGFAMLMGVTWLWSIVAVKEFLEGAGLPIILAAPTYGVLVIFQVLRRGMHYAVDRPARESLYAVMDADAKYKSKPFIDTFVYRGGDLIGGWTPLLLAKLAIPVALVAVPVSIGWAVVGMVLGNRGTKPVPNLCTACGYSLAGLRPRTDGRVVCPECGMSALRQAPST